MANLDVLTYGFALTSDQGAFGYSTNSLLTVGNNNILVDTGPSSRRTVLYRALESKNLTPDDIDIVILTHMHWDHCQNTDLFRNARILLHPTEMDRMGVRERIEQVARAPGKPFDHGLYRIVRESTDPDRRTAEGPVQIDHPRTSRTVDRWGPGQPVA